MMDADGFYTKVGRLSKPKNTMPLKGIINWESFYIKVMEFSTSTESLSQQLEKDEMEKEPKNNLLAWNKGTGV